MTAMHTDAWGLPVTTSSSRALESYDRGIRGLLGWEACALDEFEQARREDPALALAHAGSAVCLFLEERFADARAAGGGPASRARPVPLERSHFERWRCSSPASRPMPSGRCASIWPRTRATSPSPAAPYLVLAGAVPGDAGLHDVIAPQYEAAPLRRAPRLRARAGQSVRGGRAHGGSRARPRST